MYFVFQIPFIIKRKVTTLVFDELCFKRIEIILEPVSTTIMLNDAIMMSYLFWSLFMNETSLKPRNTVELKQMLQLTWNKLPNETIHQFVLSFREQFQAHFKANRDKNEKASRGDANTARWL